MANRTSTATPMVAILGGMLLGWGCGGGDSWEVDLKVDGSIEADAEAPGTEDTGTEDTGTEDTGTEDTGTEDTGTEDTGTEDTGHHTQCDPACENHGTCTASGTCDCTGTGYSGDRCQHPICEPGCENGGTCKEPGLCECPPEYSGDLCDACAPHLSNYPDCDQCAPNLAHYPDCDQCEPLFSNYPDCDQCAPDAFGLYPACFLPSADFYETNFYFPVLPTNQNKCFSWLEPWEEIACPGVPGSCGLLDAGCGQDAQYPENPQTFTCYNANGSLQDPCQTDGAQSGVVVESLTGLMWQRAAARDKNWDQAQEYCANLAHAGYNDWRLPRPHELRSTMDLSTRRPAYNTTLFPGEMGILLSSLPRLTNTNNIWYAWVFGGSIGGLGQVTKDDPMSVLCVRGNETLGADGPSSSLGSRFVTSDTNGDKEVIDTVTGLIWQEDYTPQRRWVQALDICERSGYAGHSNWRLPTFNEKASLINYGIHSPASDFPNMPLGWFWSSTTVDDPGLELNEFARIVGFEEGYDDAGKKDQNYLNQNQGINVRCVRGGP